MSDIDLKSERMLDLIGNETGGDKPSFFPLVESYLRAFQRHRHATTDKATMPADARIMGAVRRVYRDATAEEREVMIGTSALPSRERSMIRTRVILRIAKAAGLTCGITET